MAGKQTFKTELHQSPGMEATGIKLPFDINEVWGAKRVKVRAVINGVEYRGSAVSMGGEYWMGVPKAFRDATGIKAGDHITVTMERDDQERIVIVPDELASALKSAGLRESWDALNYSTRKEHARSINEAKGEDTRARRIEKIINGLKK